MAACLSYRKTHNGKLGKIKTEVLFIERCLDLLKPGGRLGIVLPEGIFNNPSLTYVREFVEDRARLLAVVSLPQETATASHRLQIPPRQLLLRVGVQPLHPIRAASASLTGWWSKN